MLGSDQGVDRPLLEESRKRPAIGALARPTPDDGVVGMGAQVIGRRLKGGRG